MNDNESIRVLIADDHPVVRAGIAALLDAEPDITVIGQAADGGEAVRLATELKPDVLLMDLRMPVMDGDEATARIVAGDPGIRILILTTHESDDHILTAIEAGARGYLIKAAPAEQILAGLRAVASGSLALAPELASRMLQRSDRRDRLPTLTDREKEVLTLVAEGLANKQIAQRLFLGEATVKTHLLRAFEKLGVKDRTRAVTLAMELGLL